MDPNSRRERRQSGTTVRPDGRIDAQPRVVVRLSGGSPDQRASCSAHLDPLLPAVVPVCGSPRVRPDTMARLTFKVDPDEPEAPFQACRRVSPVAALGLIDDSPRFPEPGLPRMVGRGDRLALQD